MLPSKTLMRYLTRSKFEYLLEDKGIYVGAACDQSDPNEGNYDHRYLSSHLRRLSGCDESLMEKVDDMMLGSKNVGRENTYLSCWYCSDEESPDMWEEYGKDGIILFSTDLALQLALPEPLNQATEFYELTYNDQLKSQANQQPFRFKNERYKHEKEYRIEFNHLKYSVLTGFEARCEVLVGGVPSHQSDQITSCMSPKAIAQSHRVIRRKCKGYILAYPLADIIHEVRLHPNASDEELEQARAALRARGINCTVRHSMLRGLIVVEDLA